MTRNIELGVKKPHTRYDKYLKFWTCKLFKDEEILVDGIGDNPFKAYENFIQRAVKFYVGFCVK